MINLLILVPLLILPYPALDLFQPLLASLLIFLPAHWAVVRHDELSQDGPVVLIFAALIGTASVGAGLVENDIHVVTRRVDVEVEVAHWRAGVLDMCDTTWISDDGDVGSDREIRLGRTKNGLRRALRRACFIGT
ncbi:hypothetical protein K461DRAFT_86591 [Myriangium duriaei CBS 260.36]|uniref:Uncharacterized protein n=1 Tax=Myriangium duriaei CBS 260.36 TaxID=1168546 RepID=A0A9P4J8F3_9PEZI|nr:hypothetical protein K461DRAFT_86591 [Myriangium duriaei CBS 260.36]